MFGLHLFKELTLGIKHVLCQVYFYVEDTSHLGSFSRESYGRLALENIRWDSILNFADGFWDGQY